MAAASEAVSQVQVSSYYIRHYIEGTLKTPSGTFTIKPLFPHEMFILIDFFATVKGEFHRNGETYPADKIAARVAQLANRFLNGEPWSCYLIRSVEEGELAGYFTIGYDDDTSANLHIAMLLAEKFRGKKIATVTWKWVTEEFLPKMYINDARVHGKPLYTTRIRALTHPDHKEMNEGLKKAGFLFVKETNIESFKGEKHDGRRNLYEIFASQFLSPEVIRKFV